MFNIIRMELYRLFKTKSMYVIWIVMLLMVILSTVIVATDTVSEDERQVTQEYHQEENVGVSVVLPTLDKESLTLSDFVTANMQARVIVIFIVIFAVIYTTADTGTGYIKNIAGQMKKREYLVVGKVVALFVNVVITTAIFVAGQALSNLLFLGHLDSGGLGNLAAYLGIQVLLHFAMAVVSMAVAAIIRNSVVSMTLVICISMNIMAILYSGIDKLVQKAGIENFQTIKHTVMGKISQLLPDMAGKDMAYAVITALVFTGAAGVITACVCRKRDI